MGQGKTRLANEVGGRHFHIVKVKLGEPGRTEPHHIADGFNAKTRSVPGHQTRRRPLVELPKHQKHVGDLGTANPFFVAVQNEMVTFGNKSSRQGLDVAPSARLRQSKGPDHLSLGQGRKPFFFLLLRTPL